jgi:hypothetical protein
MLRTQLGASRFSAIIRSDADMRDVNAADVAEWLAAQHADVRDAKEFRAAERDAVYDAREREEDWP